MLFGLKFLLLKFKQEILSSQVSIIRCASRLKIWRIQCLFSLSGKLF